MESSLCRLDVVVRDLLDVKNLYRTWIGLCLEEDLDQTESVLVRVSLDGQLPEKEVALRFYAPEDVLDLFLNILKHNGVRLSCAETLPGIGQTWKIEPDDTW